MMPFDELDERIRNAIAQEVEAGLPRLAGMEARVMAELAARPDRRPFWARLARARWRWALAGCGVAVLAIGFVIGRLSAPGPSPLLAHGGSLFAVAVPGARMVAVVGDFSAWQPVPLADPDGDGIWTATIALPPGRYEYAFVVDGRWIGQDPLADEYVRSFGEYASVRYIGGGS
ncbi:MAG: glycogen-binding domain-containing protein [Candidatus Acetothermia bacterium]|jgi:hypothetical protein|nr:glycogen-binding domain-containing protein [Candidatus Acetothermia bacterium]